jgi:DNA-binding transcriptional ArsR family regulator
MVEEMTAFKPADEMVIADLETLRVLADPLRLSIVEYLAKPGTVKRIAEKLGKPPTKLYYHFNLLEKHELITLVDTRVVSGIIEKHYQASARQYRLKRGLLSPGTGESGQELDLTLSSLFADTRNDIIESIRAGVIKLSEDAPDYERLIFSGGNLMLTNEQAADFIKRLAALMKEYMVPEIAETNETNPDAHLHKLFYIYYPSSRLIRDNGETDAE